MVQTSTSMVHHEATRGTVSRTPLHAPYWGFSPWRHLSTVLCMAMWIGWATAMGCAATSGHPNTKQSAEGHHGDLRSIQLYPLMLDIDFNFSQVEGHGQIRSLSASTPGTSRKQAYRQTDEEAQLEFELTHQQFSIFAAPRPFAEPTGVTIGERLVWVDVISTEQPARTFFRQTQLTIRSKASPPPSATAAQPTLPQAHHVRVHDLATFCRFHNLQAERIVDHEAPRGPNTPETLCADFELATPPLPTLFMPLTIRPEDEGLFKRDTSSEPVTQPKPLMEISIEPGGSFSDPSPASGHAFTTAEIDIGALLRLNVTRLLSLFQHQYKVQKDYLLPGEPALADNVPAIGGFVFETSPLSDEAPCITP